MATVAAPRRPLRDFDLRGAMDWLERRPAWAVNAVVLVVLIGVSAYLRTRFISGQFWMDEAITTGIAMHPLSQIPGILRHDGSPPLFYVLLHFWIQLFGSSEAATHALPLLFGLLTIPIGLWAGTSLFGRRAGYMTAILFTFSAFLTDYAQETRMYELMGLLGLLATAGFLHGFVYRRRRYVILFAVSLALMFYTHTWGIFFAAGALIALIPVYRASDDKRGIVRDALFAFVAAGVLYLPWLPNFIYQATHTGDPWAPSPKLGAPVLISRDLMGGDRVTVALVFGAIFGFIPLFRRAMRRSREATLMWALIVLPTATLLLAWLASQVTPAFISRYFAPVLAAIILLLAFGNARAGILGILMIAASVLFLYNPASVAPQYKSNMRDIAGELAPMLHKGDLVIVSQPEQTPLAWYYLPAGLRYANTLGPVQDPSYMNWVYALKRLEHAQPAATLMPLLASLKPGQQVLYVRPMTEGAQNWEASWTELVRLRSAQWGALLAHDPNLISEVPENGWAPHNYRGACCVANSALLYRVK